MFAVCYINLLVKFLLKQNFSKLFTSVCFNTLKFSKRLRKSFHNFKYKHTLKKNRNTYNFVFKNNFILIKLISY